MSSHTPLPWSERFIEKYKDKWNWDVLSRNESLPWTEEFIENYKDKWTWSYKDILNWIGIFNNQGIQWNLRMLLKFVINYTNDKVVFKNSNIWEVLKPFVDDTLIEEVFDELNNKKQCQIKKIQK